MARPKAEINWTDVDYMLKCQCSGVEIADALGIHPETLYAACERDHKLGFSVYSQQKKSAGVTNARQRFYEQCWIDTAEDRTRATKQIFWLKNHADMSDKQDVKHSGSVGPQLVMYLPNNGKAAPAPGDEG